MCFGTRPEAIKMAPIIRELKDRKTQYKICVTAQHREMLDQVLDFFEIVPDYDLSLMKPAQSLNSLSAGILDALDPILDDYFPDLVLVQGDTTTAAMVALGCFHKKIKIGHIEAGLRTYNIESPFPEEANRQIISKIADFHFAPTQDSKNNLINEGIDSQSISLTGNTVVDALHWALRKINSNIEPAEITQIKKLINSDKKLILVTGHRRENFGDGLMHVCEALKELAKNEDLEIIYILHLNPNVSEPIGRMLGKVENIHLVPPVSYPVMIWLLKECDLIISDSGGIQEEAPSFNKQVLVTREYTERMEGVNSGYCYLVGTDKIKISETANRLLRKSQLKNEIINPYGDGVASKRIVDFLITH